MNKNNPDVEDLLTLRQSRRSFIRKVAYSSPVLLTLPAAPSFAQQGSGAGGGVGDNGDPDDMPTMGPRPISELDCDQPLQPIDSDFAQNMCELTFDEDDGSIFFQDVIVDNDAVAGRLEQGNLIGTCDSFLCNAS